MPLIYITGPTAAGKSTIRALLKDRGYAAHDTDEDGISLHYSRQTGEVVEYPKDPKDRTPEWHADHAFNMSPERIKQLAKRAETKTIFLCGVAANDLELAHYFSKIICLVIDQETMKHRVATRKTNNFGKAPDELKTILEWYQPVLDKYAKAGVIMIDASQPLNKVLDDILAKSVDFFQVGQASLGVYVQTIQNLIKQGEQFDVIAAAGDSGQLTARITEEVYKVLGKPVPPKLVAPIYRHADEAETILFDNKILAPQFSSRKDKLLSNVLFVDDEIGGGNAARGILDLLLELNPDIQTFTIVAEDGGFNCPSKIRGVKTRFIPTRSRVPGVYNAISHTVPRKFHEPLKTVLADEPDLNDKQIMCTLLHLPTKEFNNGKPEFNERLITQAQQTLPNFPDLQKEYQEYFIATIKGCLWTSTSPSTNGNKS